MRILLIANDRPPSLGISFKTALRQMGHEVRLVDDSWAYSLLDRRPFRSITRKWLGPYPSGRALFRWLVLRECAKLEPDFVLSTQGRPLDREILGELRAMSGAPFAVYSTDNPFNSNVSTKALIDALPLWDAIFTPRRSNIEELQRHCGGRVIYLPFGYDPDLYYPERPRNHAEATRFRSDVVFIGAIDHDRIPFLEPLATTANLRSSFYGGNSPHKRLLRRRHRGMAIGRRYRLALNMSKIALCLVRRANADGHVMRTFEVPACGAFMLAERTEDHEAMFKEGEEAAFFSGPEEMMDKIKYYLNHDEERVKIAERGHARVVSGRNSYADRLLTLLASV